MLIISIGKYGWVFPLANKPHYLQAQNLGSKLPTAVDLVAHWQPGFGAWEYMSEFQWLAPPLLLLILVIIRNMWMKVFFPKQFGSYRPPQEAWLNLWEYTQVCLLPSTSLMAANCSEVILYYRYPNLNSPLFTAPARSDGLLDTTPLPSQSLTLLTMTAMDCMHSIAQGRMPTYSPPIKFS